MTANVRLIPNNPVTADATKAVRRVSGSPFSKNTGPRWQRPGTVGLSIYSQRFRIMRTSPSVATA